MPGKRIKLLIPGPVEVHADVLKAMGSQVEPHYGDTWVEMHGHVIELLKKVFNTKHDVFLMTGSGTAAIDACFGSALQTAEKVIIGVNGFFGDRLVNIAKGYGLEVVTVNEEWGKPLNPMAIQEALTSHPDAKAVALVHCETSTTVVNPVEEMGDMVHNHGAILILDSVSSLGGMHYDLDGWGVDLCASATQKCLGAPPGLAPVAVSPRAWEAIDRNPNKAHGWYTDLRVWRQYSIDWGDWHPTPITMATSIVNALLVSLNQLMQEGIPARLARFRKLALQLRQGLRDSGMPPFTPDELMSPVLTAAYPPDGVASSEIVKYLLDEFGIQISSGLGHLRTKIFRIGHMSPNLSESDIQEVIDALMQFGRH